MPKRKRNTSQKSIPSNLRAQELKPSAAFYAVLRQGGATKDWLTGSEIIYYLRLYIESRELYDRRQPSVVHCGGDSLGQVFRVDTFTIRDVLSLIVQHTTPLTAPSSKGCLVSTEQQPSTSKGYLDLKNEDLKETLVTGPKDNDQRSEKHPTCHCETGGRKRQKHDSGREEGRYSRRRGSSISLIYSGSDGEGISVLYGIESEEDKLSIQGYETSVVQDSVDEFSDSELEGVTVVGTDDQFEVEYDVPFESETENEVPSAGSESEGSVVVVCDESDVDFWADSSNTSDSDSDTDMEIADEDKWRCKDCFNLNSPLRGYCDQCATVRPHWLPEKRTDARYACKRSVSTPGRISTDNGSVEPPTAASTERSPRAAYSQSTPSFLGQTPAVPMNMLPNHGVNQPSRPSTSHFTETRHKSECSENNAREPPVHASGDEPSCSQEPTSRKPTDPCVICMARPKDASLIHGRTGHLVCCCVCAKKLKKRRRPCPICRKPIDAVIKTYR